MEVMEMPHPDNVHTGEGYMLYLLRDLLRKTLFPLLLFNKPSPLAFNFYN
jgi:hypothetical protein